jgi:hypothetical protein
MKVEFKVVSPLNDGVNKVKQIEYRFGNQVEIIN